MNKRPDLEMIDDENPEWSEEDFARAVPATKLPENLQRKLGIRGRQKAPTKERITIRLSRDVLEHFRATGRGWQGRIDAALQEWLETHKQG